MDRVLTAPGSNFEVREYDVCQRGHAKVGFSDYATIRTSHDLSEVLSLIRLFPDQYRIMRAGTVIYPA